MTDNLITLTSQLDQSVNFITPASGVGFFEARHVRRDPAPGQKVDYVIFYLSSQSGCDQACRFCHLTATGQNKFVNAEYQDFMDQADTFFAFYDSHKPAQLVHFNFMARGEALNNPLILQHSAKLLNGLKAYTDQRGLDSKFLISTIMPAEMGAAKLTEIFPEVHPEIYYSLYSMSPKFRKRWLPRAHTAEHGLDLLKEWQDSTGKVPKIHFAFIEGQNDSEDDMLAMAAAINERELKVNLNIVRYNPHSERHGREPQECVIQRNTDLLAGLINAEQVRIVPKVGFDVKASCGMFVDKDHLIVKAGA
jgi:adenine C2-methylase RlmN of 23S rRNA A2503 and tRNA A37